jgi:hypothetical protein
MSEIEILPLGLGRGMINYKITLLGTYQGKDLPKTL